MDTKPYKIREKVEKEAGYRDLIRAELADELYDGILTITAKGDGLTPGIFRQLSIQDSE